MDVGKFLRKGLKHVAMPPSETYDKYQNRFYWMKLFYNVVFLFVILGISFATQAFDHISSEGAAKLDKIIGIIKEKHIKTISEEQLIEAAANGILASLDPYSYFYNTKSFEEINTYTVGEFCGIGIEIKVENGKASVVTPLNNSPAAHAGILPEDKIISINNIPIEGMSEQTIMKRLLGKPNTKISLKIFREGSKINPIKFSMMRNKVELPSIESKFFSDGFFYLKIGAFYENTTKAMEKIATKLENLQRKNKIKGIIVDLRNNPGGLLEQAIDVASLFIKKGRLISIISPRNGKDIKYLSERTYFKLNETIPVVVLINKGTASAAEVLAGALKDYKRATIVGEKSFGKGSVQVFVPLEDGEAMSVTTALYKTPSGTTLENIGVIPDVNIFVDQFKKLKEKERTKFLKQKMNKKELDVFLKRRAIMTKAIMIMINKTP
jgi:carboxyl-terminal processing protease